MIRANRNKLIYVSSWKNNIEVQNKWKNSHKNQFLGNC